MPNNDITTTRKALIDDLRKHCEGYTQQQIADESGLHRTNVNRVLSGRYPPSIDVLLKIAKAVGVRINLTKDT